MAYFRPTNIDSTLNQLHRAVVNSEVRMHQAQHMEEVPTGEKPSKTSVPKGGSGSSNSGSSLGTLKEPA